MNEDTRVSVHCYEGDAHQVRAALHLYTHHQCPLTIISPTDSRVIIDGVDCRSAGTREGSVITVKIPDEPVERIVTHGPIANQRQIEQMKLLLTFPENFFLMNDADSFCLSPKIPHYLYETDDTIWSLVAHDPNDAAYAALPANFPHFALQPPYFAHRKIIGRLVAAAPVTYEDWHPHWIDGFMMLLAFTGGVTYRPFRDGYGADLDRYPRNLGPAVSAVRHGGKVFIHSSKSPTSWGPLVRARAEYLKHRRARA